MRVDLFDFELPQERIALEPASPRDAARLLYVGRESIDDHSVRDLATLLRPGDLLVTNDTKVIPAQLLDTVKAELAVNPFLSKQHYTRILAVIAGAPLCARPSD